MWDLRKDRKEWTLHLCMPNFISSRGRILQHVFTPVQESTPLHNHRVRKKAKELFEESSMSYTVRWGDLEGNKSGQTEICTVGLTSGG